MTTIDDSYHFPVGDVAISDLSSGAVVAYRHVHNTTCKAAANAIAAAYAGDVSLVPRKVAFLYGDDPSSAPTLNKETTWESLSGLNKAIVGFSYRTTVDENTAVFHARTQGVPDNSYIFAACLLGASVTGNEYEVLAVVDLGSKKKPGDFELSIDWSVRFNDGAVSDESGDEDTWES